MSVEVRLKGTAVLSSPGIPTCASWVRFHGFVGRLQLTRSAGANYRKATSPSRGFPAALQDAIRAYTHLVVDLGYQNVILAGDSAGGKLLQLALP